MFDGLIDQKKSRLSVPNRWDNTIQNLGATQFVRHDLESRDRVASLRLLHGTTIGNRNSHGKRIMAVTFPTSQGESNLLDMSHARNVRRFAPASGEHGQEHCHNQHHRYHGNPHLNQREASFRPFCAVNIHGTASRLVAKPESTQYRAKLFDVVD